METLRPGIYSVDIPPTNMPIEAMGTSTGAFVGITPRGVANKPVQVTSWTEFCNTFALGLESPFLRDSDLAYAVYGFFLNGGSRCYIVRATNTSFKAATITQETSTLEVTAKDVGTWGNKLKVNIAQAKDLLTGTVREGYYTFTVVYDGVTVEQFTGAIDVNSQDYYVDVVNTASKFIVVSAVDNLIAGDLTLVGGVDTLSTITDTDYVAALNKLMEITDIINVAVPGQTSTTVAKAVCDLANAKPNVYGVIDAPMGADKETVKTFRAELSGRVALYHNWLYVTDPLSKQGKLRLTPPSGHMIGVTANIDKAIGVHQAPAGTDFVIKGAVSLEQVISDGDLEIFNPLCINSIISVTNVGIVSWGARTLSTDPSLRYINVLRLDIKIKVSIENGTSWALFKPNKPELWHRLKTSIKSFLYSIWKDGALQGVTAEQAYFVKIDSENNPQETIDLGKLYANIGYAPTKPAEFIIYQYQREVSSSK